MQPSKILAAPVNFGRIGFVLHTHGAKRCFHPLAFPGGDAVIGFSAFIQPHARIRERCCAVKGDGKAERGRMDGAGGGEHRARGGLRSGNGGGLLCGSLRRTDFLFDRCQLAFTAQIRLRGIERLSGPRVLCKRGFKNGQKLLAGIGVGP